MDLCPCERVCTCLSQCVSQCLCVLVCSAYISIIIFDMIIHPIRPTDGYQSHG